MKIYTKTGDKGTTGLIGGKRVSKDSTRIAAYGDVEELNAVLGIVLVETTHDPLRKTLREIQETLFTLGAQLASPDEESKMPVVTAKHVDFLERQIDVLEEGLPPLRNFILPGGTRTAAFLHLARTVCRRAERNVVKLASEPAEKVDHWAVVFLNRLSDFLFVMARLANQLENVPDIPWVAPKRS